VLQKHAVLFLQIFSATNVKNGSTESLWFHHQLPGAAFQAFLAKFVKPFSIFKAIASDDIFNKEKI